MTTLLPCQRALFEIPDEIAYLNCAYMSPILRSTREAGQAGIGRKSQPWQIHPADFFTGPERARALVAELIGGDADGVAIVPSAGYGIAVAAANVPVAAGQRIVVLADQFPANVYAWREVARRQGAEVVTVPWPEDHDWTRSILAHLDERVAVVTAPHCHWTNGSLVDLVRIGQAARSVDAALVVDATQSLGAYPLDVQAVQPDFLIAATYKWLLGPYSLGFLYVAPRFREGTPLEYGWVNRAGSEDFRNLVQYRDAYQPGARRFDMGEHANFSLLPMAINALEQLLAWGVSSIAATIGELTNLLEGEARRLGLQPVPAEYRGNHLIGIRMPEGVAADLEARLAAAQVYVSLRGQSIRVAPHVYNTAAEIGRLVAVLATVV